MRPSSPDHSSRNHPHVSRTHAHHLPRQIARWDAITVGRLRATGGRCWAQHPDAPGLFITESGLGTAPAVTRAMPRAVADGAATSRDGVEFIRLVLATPRPILVEAARRIARAVREHGRVARPAATCTASASMAA